MKLAIVLATARFYSMLPAGQIRTWTAIWPALGFSALGLWLLFNPWWGAWPAAPQTPIGAVMILASYLAAAALSYVSPDVPHVRGIKWMVPVSTVACAAHIFVAATLVVRWIYHSHDMAESVLGDVELWIYSAVWAVFGAVTLGHHVVSIVAPVTTAPVPALPPNMSVNRTRYGKAPWPRGAHCLSCSSRPRRLASARRLPLR